MSMPGDENKSIKKSRVADRIVPKSIQLASYINATVASECDLDWLSYYKSWDFRYA